MSTTRHCPLCGTPFPASTGRGRPRVYCCDQCRWAAGHAVAREQARQRNAEWAAWSFDDLLTWVSSQEFGPL